VTRGIDAAIRLVKEGGAHSVKLEGATPTVLGIIRELTSHGIPVTGHVGLIPQSVHAFGGFKMQGKDNDNARRILSEAHDIEAAGAHAIVLESIPHTLAGTITDALKIPTIGIGAGPLCDGQVLVINDLLGIDDRFCPGFVKQYANLALTITDAVERYALDVRQGSFPESKDQ
ncbi:3-methyl-2-oxobutanoate hydroxymethyltransferase, partial [Myxococcota bacterium]|nr:3-methyl-2-oxobutanoate hydroxymethyltransferase [Myxococcota bacterium]